MSLVCQNYFHGIKDLNSIKAKYNKTIIPTKVNILPIMAGWVFLFIISMIEPIALNHK